MAGGSLADDGWSQDPTANATTLRQMLRAALIRRCQRSSASVHPFCFTFNHRRVGPASYRLASSLATKPS